MHSYLTEVLAGLDDSHATVTHALDLVPPALRATKPGPNRWSVDEIVEHLALVNARFDATVGEAIARARQAGLGPEASPRVPLADVIHGRLRDRSERREAPENMIPTGALHGAAAVAAWETSRQRFRDTVTAADGLALGTVMAEHRRWGPLTAYQWAEVMASHEKRHAAQIEEAAAQLQGIGAVRS
jgi:hypothetical protein